MFYIGQIVGIPEEDEFGIFTGEDKNNEAAWVFHYNKINNDYDVYAHDKVKLAYVKIPDKTFVSGSKIYHGPFCKFSFNANIPDKEMDRNRDAIIKELNKLNKTLKPKKKNGKTITTTD